MFGTEVTVIVNCGKKQDSKIVKILLFLLTSCIMGIVKTRKRITDFKISTPPASETTYIYKYMNKIMNVQKWVHKSLLTRQCPTNRSSLSLITSQTVLTRCEIRPQELTLYCSKLIPSIVNVTPLQSYRAVVRNR